MSTQSKNATTMSAAATRQTRSMAASLLALSLLIAVAGGCNSKPPAPAPARVNRAVQQPQPTQLDDETPVAIVDNPRIPKGGQVGKRHEVVDNLNDPRTKLERYLIVHADDVGLCRSANRATIEGFEKGIVTSASIMVPCPGFEEFAKYASAHPEYDYGIHLTLNAEFPTHKWGPVAGADAVPSLVDAEGNLLAGEVETAAKGRAADVEKELKAQIDRALERNIPLSHLDTHMGTLLVRPDFMQVYLDLAQHYNLPILITRGGSDMTLFPLADEVKPQLDEIVATLDKKQLPVLDHIIMHYAVDRTLVDKLATYHNAFRFMPEGVTEVIVHPAFPDNEMAGITSSLSIRSGDRRLVTDPATKELLAKLNIKLINWKQLREMTAKRASQTTPVGN